MSPTQAKPSRSQLGEARFILAWGAALTLLAGLLADAARGSVTEASLMTSTIRAWAAGELSVLWWRWSNNQPMRAEPREDVKPEAAVAGIEGA